MSKMLPTWLNVSCRCRNWNIACPGCTSNFGLRCTRLGRTGCPKLCLHKHDMIWLSSLHPPTCKQISFLIVNIYFTASPKRGEYKLPYATSWPTVASVYLHWNLRQSPRCVVSHTKLISACDRRLPLSKSVHMWHFRKVRIWRKKIYTNILSKISINNTMKIVNKRKLLKGLVQDKTTT